jgi:hypothetical protein
MIYGFFYVRAAAINLTQACFADWPPKRATQPDTKDIVAALLLGLRESGVGMLTR